LQESLAELRETSHESADNWRQMQLDRLDGILATWLPIARHASHPDAVRGAAIAIRATQAQARLLGLDANVILHAAEKPTDPLQVLSESAAVREAMERLLAKAMKTNEGAAVGS